MVKQKEFKLTDIDPLIEELVESSCAEGYGLFQAQKSHQLSLFIRGTSFPRARLVASTLE